MKWSILSLRCDLIFNQQIKHNFFLVEKHYELLFTASLAYSLKRKSWTERENMLQKQRSDYNQGHGLPMHDIKIPNSLR